MATAAKERLGLGAWATNDPPCEIAVLYHDTLAREASIRLCERLSARLADEIDVRVRWWRLRYLADATVAHEAGASIACAEMILVAAPPDLELPLYVRRWLEGWLSTRRFQSGALAFLPCVPTAGAPVVPVLGRYLAFLSRKAGLDFLDATRLSGNPMSTLMSAGTNEPSTRTGAVLLSSSGWGLDEF